jgi:predicted esterase
VTDTRIIEARTHGRYLVDQPGGDGPFPVLVGFHGYSEGAERMLEEMLRVRGDRRWLLVSIQALNRFYSKASTVVAGWMTREDRELAIDDNLAYVRSVVAAVRRGYPVNDVLVYAGFSQGVAMAYRAAAFVAAEDGIPAPRGVILLAGDIPPDVAPTLRGFPPLLIGRGTTDHWYTEPKAELDLETFRTAGVQPELHLFEGGHVWDDSFVARAGTFLDTIAF